LIPLPVRLGLGLVAIVFAIETFVFAGLALTPAKSAALYYGQLAGDPPVVFGCLVATIGAGFGPLRRTLSVATLAFLVVAIVVVGNFAVPHLDARRLAELHATLFATSAPWMVADAANLIGFIALVLAADQVGSGAPMPLVGANLAVIAGRGALSVATYAAGWPPTSIVRAADAVLFAVTAVTLFVSLRGR
jgi:hypothetical protein